MLVSLDWISDFVKLPELSAKELGLKFTMATAEVEEVKVEGEFWKKIRIGEITHIERHPNAEKLNLVSFKLGDNEEFRVVCGASNVRVGLRVAFAPIGTTLPVGFTLEPKKIRGVLSEGMLCSQEELGLAESSAGIWELPADAPLGVTLAEYLDMPADIILDIDNKSLTHRPDLWGHWGMAREFATIFSTPLEDRFNQQWMEKLEQSFTEEKSPIIPEVDSDSASLGYWGISLDGIEVKESPNWLKRRLNAVGLRPINNIVDVSNYVMLELGIPMHIFDRQKIAEQKLHIHRLKEDVEFTTLDEQVRQLKAGDTVIADAKEPLVIAGIMGGLSSGVTESTTQIFIEVANWKAAEIRKVSTRLGLRTDSSMRYEKALDSQLLKRTLLRAVELVKELSPAARIVGKAEYAGPSLEYRPLVIRTSYAKINSVLGLEIDQSRINTIFNTLGFVTEQQGEGLVITVPSYRATKDIEYEADLIEEIGRIVGYDNIPVSAPKLTIAPVQVSSAKQLHNRLRNFLIMRERFYETMSYPLIGRELYSKAKWPYQDDLQVVNALSKDADTMRSSLVPQLLSMVAQNQKNFKEFSIFELGRVYIPSDKEFAKEHSHIGLVCYSKEQETFLKLQDTCLAMFRHANLPADLCDKHPKFLSTVVDEKWEGLHPFEFQNIRLMGKMEGAIFSIHPQLLRSLKIKGNVTIAILNLSQVEQRKIKDKITYKPLPKFPGSTFDWTVVKRDEQRFGDLINPLRKIKIKELQRVEVVDQFKSGDVTYVTLSASFLDPEKTLSGDFLLEAKEKLIDCCKKAGFELKL